jgi:hypothetical protein
MITNGKRLQRISCGVVLSALIAAPAVAADSIASVVRITDEGGVHQIVVSIGPFEVTGPAGSSFAWSTRLPHGVMLHRVGVLLVDAFGQPFDGAPEWAAALSIGPTGASMPLVQRSILLYALELPRPLGLRLDPEDSVAVRGHVDADGTSAPLHVRITLDYEPLGGPLSRFAVLPLQLRLSGPADRAAGTDAAHVMREWQVPVDGRIMVIVGVPADASGELILEDVKSGAMVWHGILQPATGEGFGRATDVVRVGAAVQAGRFYRLTLRCADGGTTGVADRLVHALVAPVRTGVRVAVRN